MVQVAETGHSYVKLVTLSVEKDRGEISIKTVIRVWARRRSDIR